MPSTAADPELLYAKLVLHYRLAPRERVEAALATRKAEGGLRGLAEILVEQGVLTDDQARRLRRVQQDVLAQKRQPSDEAKTPIPAVATEVPSPAGPPITPGPAAVPAAAPAPARAGTAPSSPALQAPSSLTDVLRSAVESGASDVHLHCGQPLLLRRVGRLEPAGSTLLTRERIEELLADMLDDDARRALLDTGQVDFVYALPGVGRFRGNAFRQQGGIDAVLRVVPLEPPTLEDLGLPATLSRFAGFHQGLVLVTGPAGCGKSSTLAALVDQVNRERRDHVITIEDPIEFVHTSRGCLVNQRQVGPHTGSFSRALRAALREDPDVIVIGELRDLETISLALTAAETGHLVLGTLHTADSVRTLYRLVGAFPPAQQSQVRAMVADSLRAVVSQRLVPRADGSGRVPALEVLLVTRAVANLVRENKVFQVPSLLQTGAAHGMSSLAASLAELVKSRVVTAEDAAIAGGGATKAPTAAGAADGVTTAATPAGAGTGAAG